MKLFILTFYKLKMMLSDRFFFAVMIILPLLITVAAGYALRNEKLGIIPVALVDEDVTQSSALIARRITEKEGLRVYSADRLKALKMLENGQVEQVFVISKDFENKIKAGISNELLEVVESPASFSAGFTKEVVAGEVMRLLTGEMAANQVILSYEKLGRKVDGGLREEITAYNDSMWMPEPLMTIDYKELSRGVVVKADKAGYPASAASSSGLIAAFLMFYMLFSSGWLVEERTNGTIKRLAIGPGALMYSYYASILSLFVAGAIQLFIFAAVDRLIFNVNIFDGILAFILLLFYLLSVIAASLFMSALFKTRAQLQAAAPIIAVLSSFAGGCFWNFIDMPEHLRLLAKATPQGWLLEGLKALSMHAWGFGTVGIYFLILGSISIILISAGCIIIAHNAANASSTGQF